MSTVIIGIILGVAALLLIGKGRGPKQYSPGSPEAVALFRQGAYLAGVPIEWANSPALHWVLGKESNGWVGVPNYTYGHRWRGTGDARSLSEAVHAHRSDWSEVWNELRQGKITAKSSATGLGQLLLSNVDRYYPDGRAGIGVAEQEAAGMLAYIKDRYGSPERAQELYGKQGFEGY